METAILVVLLSRGLSPEDVRLSMDATIARIERTLRPLQQTPEDPSKASRNVNTAPLPSDPAKEHSDAWVETTEVLDDTPLAGDF
jgi:hypothetical protein